MLSEAEPYLDATLTARIAAFLDGDAYATRDALDVPVLCHCDFKASNLYVTPADELVVLDWEFAWAGPRLLDIGQLLRWHPPEWHHRNDRAVVRPGSLQDFDVRIV